MVFKIQFTGKQYPYHPGTQHLCKSEGLSAPTESGILWVGLRTFEKYAFQVFPLLTKI